MASQIVSDYCLSILKAFSAALPPDISTRKPVKALSVLEEVADSIGCEVDALELSYRYLLKQNLLQLQFPGKDVARVKCFPSHTPSASETLNAATRFHRVLAITPAGYKLIQLSEDSSCRSKLSVQPVFDNVCKLATLGKTVFELKNLLFP